MFIIVRCDFVFRGRLFYCILWKKVTLFADNSTLGSRFGGLKTVRYCAEIQSRYTHDTITSCRYYTITRCSADKKCANNSRLRQIVMDSMRLRASKDTGDARRDLFVGRRFISTRSLMPNVVPTKSIFFYTHTFHILLRNTQQTRINWIIGQIDTRS